MSLLGLVLAAFMAQQRSQSSRRTVSPSSRYTVHPRSRGLLSFTTAAVPEVSVAAAMDASSASTRTDASSASCEALRTEVLQRAWPRITRWEKTALEGRLIPGFGHLASSMLNETLTAFDTAKATEQSEGHDSSDACSEERAEVEDTLKRELHALFLAQRSSIEQNLHRRLKKDLLRQMRRQRRELNVKEKLRLLHAALNVYDQQVEDLQPDFVDSPERERAEKRLSELQWSIHKTPEGKEMLQRWKMERTRRMPVRQSRGISVSLSPGVRVLARPAGFGNFQLSSHRTVGPPHNPNEISLGVLNDGSVIDVYNKKPSPPLIKVQGHLGIDVSLA